MKAFDRPKLRLFVEARLHAGAEIAATPGQAHYLGAVMRAGPGSLLGLFNGTDGEWQARITSLRRDRAVLAVEQLLKPQAAEPDLWLAFALLKRQATDLLVQKATELGAAALLPVLTARTQAERVNEARLRAIAIEAAEQSERLTVPRIAAPQSLAALLDTWPAGRTLVAAIERVPVPDIRPRPAPTALLVGPEGGFTEPELDALRSHAFVHPVTLGPRVLRAETAAIAGLALLQARNPPS